MWWLAIIWQLLCVLYYNNFLVEVDMAQLCKMMSRALNIWKYLLNIEGEFVSYQWEVKLKGCDEKTARKGMRITHPAAITEQGRRASPKREENGLSVQAVWEWWCRKQRKGEIQKVKERLRPGATLGITRLRASPHAPLQ